MYGNLSFYYLFNKQLFVALFSAAVTKKQSEKKIAALKISK